MPDYKSGGAYQVYMTNDTRARLEHLASEWGTSKSGALDAMIAHAYLESMKDKLQQEASA